MKDIAEINWTTTANALNTTGYAIIPGVLSLDECQQLSALYEDQTVFRNTINIRRYRFGEGEYKYFNYPLPQIIRKLREKFYTPLAEIANDWMRKLKVKIEYPSSHMDLIEHCRQKNQHRPTPLLLRYESGGFNTLHQDIYGEVYFPFQAVFVLTQEGKEHEGGEFVIAEQVPRAQSKVQVLRPGQGDAVIFTTMFRPVQGTRGYYRTTMKHGVSEVKKGVRYSLGIIFHDAT